MNKSCVGIDEARAVAFLRRALPTADSIALDDDALARVARHALAVRDDTPWGRSIPEDVFLAYVLFPRVNNEDPAFYHDAIAGQLRSRLRGLGMEAAVQQVNRWCFEQATYQSTDGRTANALTVMRRGFGRCGEESMLLVSALRACGIPARQLYVPLWSHCDDNHAWVEAWVDGRWRYMGACEPELSLDSGWFTAAASKAMLVHTRAWGVLPEGERAEARIGGAYVVNRTACYARTALLRVRVLERGLPKAGLRVDFQLANMARFGTICSKRTDGRGEADLLCGLGTLRLWLTDGERGLERTVDVAEATDHTLDFGEARPFREGEAAFTQRPPLESRMQPAGFPAARVAEHEAWLAAAEAARQARFAAPEGGDALLVDARGNRDVIARFLADAQYAPEDARALVSGLRPKDLADATTELLEDALEGALPWKANYPREVWVSDVLCPRAADEMLYPARRALREAARDLSDGEAVWRFLNARLGDCEMEPATLFPDPRAVLAHGACSAAVRDVLFVAMCRANGIAARLDPVTGEKQLWENGEYRPLDRRRGEDARLTLLNRAGRALTAGTHWSVSMLEAGGFRPLALYGNVLDDSLELRLPAGRYRAMAVTRQIDGSVDGRLWHLSLCAGEARTLELSVPPEHTADRLLRAELAPLAAVDGAGRPASLPGALAGRPALIACVAPGQEPTEHFFNELIECRDALAGRGVAVRLLVADESRLENDKLRRVLRTLADAECLTRPDEGALLDWRRALNAGELRLPLAIAVDEAGHGLFAFVNYNVGSVMSLIRVLDARELNSLQ